MKKFIFLTVFMLFDSLLFSLTIEEYKALPYNKTEFYGEGFYYNLLDKVRVFEGNSKQFISDFDNYYEYKNHELTAKEKDFFSEYFSYLPQKLQDCFLNHVYAVYFVEGMRYGGLTNFIYDEKQNRYSIVYFNIDTFYYNLDDWLEVRDNSIFTKTDYNNRIKVECSKEWRAFIHVLIHESAHVYDYINSITPYMETFDGSPKTNNIYYKYWQNMYQPAFSIQLLLFWKSDFFFKGNVAV